MHLVNQVEHRIYSILWTGAFLVSVDELYNLGNYKLIQVFFTPVYCVSVFIRTTVQFSSKKLL